MKRIYIALSLAVAQLILAFLLLAVGQWQQPQVMQDFPPYVGPATKASLAINAPVMSVEVGLIWMFHEAGTDPASHKYIWVCFYLVCAFFLWFWFGLEIQSRLQNRNEWPGSLVDCLAILIGVVLMFYAFAAWRHDETIMVAGSAAWGFAFITIYGLKLARVVTSRRAEIRSL